MALLSPVMLVPIGLFIIYRLLQSYTANRRFQQYAKQNGCAPPPDINAGGRVPMNLDLMKSIFSVASTGADVLDEIFLPLMNRLGNTVAFYSRFQEPIIITTEPVNLQTMLATKFHDYNIGIIRKKAFGVALGSGIFTSDGAQWEHSRALFRPQFSRDLINDLDSTEEATKVLFEAIEHVEHGQWSSPVDLVPVLLRFTLDTSTEFLFGQSTHSQMLAMRGSDAENSDAAAFYDAFTTIQLKMIQRIRAGKLYWLIDGLGLRKAVRTIRGFVNPLVQQAIDFRQVDGDKPVEVESGEKYSLIKALARSNIDQKELRDQLIALLAAGRDTTATLLGWTFLMLALHPLEFAKLRRAILEDIGSGDDLQNLDFSKLKNCRYLQYVLNETLRIFPPVPINNRVADKDTILPTGGGTDGKSPIALQKGTPVTFCVYLMQRRKDLWGEDACEFKPERWIDRKHDWSFLPFNGGPRVCLGQQYALTEANYLVARMLQRYDGIELVQSETHPIGFADGKWDIPKLEGITKAPKAVNVRLRKAGIPDR